MPASTRRPSPCWPRCSDWTRPPATSGWSPTTAGCVSRSSRRPSPTCSPASASAARSSWWRTSIGWTLADPGPRGPADPARRPRTCWSCWPAATPRTRPGRSHRHRPLAPLDEPARVDWSSRSARAISMSTSFGARRPQRRHPALPRGAGARGPLAPAGRGLDSFDTAATHEPDVDPGVPDVLYAALVARLNVAPNVMDVAATAATIGRDVDRGLLARPLQARGARLLDALQALIAGAPRTAPPPTTSASTTSCSGS